MPSDPHSAQFEQARALLGQGQLGEADALVQTILERAPAHAPSLWLRGIIAGQQGAHDDAATHFRASIAAQPDAPELRAALIQALERAGRYRDALAASEDALARMDAPPLRLAHATLLLRLGRNEDGLAVLDGFDDPALPPRARGEIALQRGHALRTLGRRDDAVAAYRASAELDPDRGAPWWALADMKTGELDSEDRARTEWLMMRAPDAGERVQAAFAFAAAHSDDPDPAKTVARYSAANSLQPRAFRGEGFDAAIERLVAAWTPEALAEQGRVAIGPRPIFIVGLPRSGSTLVEQMLASHPQVEGTQELPLLPSVKERAHLLCRRKHGASYLDGVGSLDGEALSELGAHYMREAAIFRDTDRPNFTDKLPHNWEHVGLIHKILPHAAIVDVRRDPVDCGWSLFRQYFARGVGFSRRLSDIGSYYRGYVRMMDHWDEVLPGRVHRLRYEALVEDPQGELRALCAYLGLEWNPAMLAHHETARSVRTASSEQVRRPLNRAGLGSGRRIEAHLPALVSALGPHSDRSQNKAV